MNFYEYINEFVFTLPQKVQSNILKMLDDWHNKANYYWVKMYRAEDNDTKEYYKGYYEKFKMKQKDAINLLNMLNIYPVINWAGHRDNYFFPTEIDCEMEEDWRIQCSD